MATMTISAVAARKQDGLRSVRVYIEGIVVLCIDEVQMPAYDYTGWKVSGSRITGHSVSEALCDALPNGKFSDAVTPAIKREISEALQSFERSDPVLEELRAIRVMLEKNNQTSTHSTLFRVPDEDR